MTTLKKTLHNQVGIQNYRWSQRKIFIFLGYPRENILSNIMESMMENHLITQNPDQYFIQGIKPIVN